MFDIFVGTLIGCVVSEWLRRILNKRKQYTFIYCKGCGNELISSNSFVSDDNGIITYKCSKCGLSSKYNFIDYPVPVLVHDGGDV